MPKVQFEDERGRRQMAEALAQDLGALPHERKARNGTRTERACWVALDIVAPTAFCLGLFWIVYEVRIFWN